LLYRLEMPSSIAAHPACRRRRSEAGADARADVSEKERQGTMFKPIRWIFRLASLAVLASAIFYWMRGPAIADHSYLVIDISGSYSEARPGGIIQRLIQQGSFLSDITEPLRKVRYDGRIDGVVIRIGDVTGGWAQAHEIRSALGLVKARGKKVVAELEVELAPASVETWIASVADAVYVAPAAAPLLTGLQAKSVFFGGLWPKIDVGIQVEKLREYKSAGDELSRESMTPAHREMVDSILDDMSRQFMGTLASARNLSVPEIQAAIEHGITSPAHLVSAGLANAVRSHEEVISELGSGTPVATVSDEAYSGVRASSLGIGDGPSIAILHASGTISTGKSPPGGASIGSRSFSQALRRAAADEKMSAIVLRVASPGGSPAASDEVWLAVREAAKKKPVIASLGDVAASGGYYLASAADRIVASPGTLTGSIGVVFFKPDVSGLLARAGVRTETVHRGRYSRLLDLDKPLDDAELTLVRTQIEDIYGLFLERVATGRKKNKEEVDRIGGGRVWTGQQAFERGLVDEIGTLEDAVRAAANAAGIHDTDKVKLVHYPIGDSVADRFGEAGAGFAQSMQPAVVTAIARVLGDAGVLLSLDPGVAAVADGVPVIE
jgi:protease-4